MNNQMTIDEYCKKRDTTLLDILDTVAKEKFISMCVRVLFQSPDITEGGANKEIAMEVLEHFGVVKSFYKAQGKNIIHYTGNMDTSDPVKELLYIGVTTVPVYSPSELTDIGEKFDEACLTFPEYLRSASNPSKNPDNQDLLYVLGGFGAYGNPASFHNMFVRDLRNRANQSVKNKLLKPLVTSYPDQKFAKKLKSQVLFDRMMNRPAMQEPTAEAWHRDIIEKSTGNIAPGDIIFGGWVNTSKHPQAFSYIPGSHLGVDLYSLKSGGFAEPGAIFDKSIGTVQKKIKNSEDDDEKEKLKSELKELRGKRKKLYELFKQYKSRTVVPPGHAIIFPQYILHEVVSKGVNHAVKRVFTGYRLTTSNELLMVDKKTRKPTLLDNVKNQSIMRLGGGMLPPIYSANHGMSFLHKKFFIYGSKNPKHGKKADAKNQIKETTITWSNKNFKDVCKINRPARNGKDAYQIVKRYMNSLKEMGLPLYPEYTKKELEIYYPQDLTDASFSVKRSAKRVRKVKTVRKVRRVRKGHTIVSWNVNSLRSRIVDGNTGTCKAKERPIKKTSPLGELLTKTKADIICFQETKCTCDTRQCFNPKGFHTYWNCSKTKKGYSGVSIWSKTEPDKVSYDLPGLNSRSAHLLKEGRILTAYYPTFILVTTYSPNTLRAGSQRVDKSYPKPEFMQYRADWDEAMLKYLKDLQKKLPVVWCGDFNAARGPMDIYKGGLTKDKLSEYGKVVVTDDEIVFTPKKDLSGSELTQSKKLEKRWLEGMRATIEGGGAGYRLEEREGLEKFIKSGFVDVYRKKYPKKYGFTYWDMMRPAFRGVNYGMRIDYFIVSKKLVPKIKSIKVYPDLGYDKSTRKVVSDHAPLVLKM
jgi:exodeoxyribonuclease-3